ncbi:ATP-dependent endonuclease [Vibrio sp. NC2]|uniref:ATP-dependent nuclease n=1 Tax=Vibrio sp. NC2 TaxID=2974562 RepID=UPI0021A2E16C|nr:AAA family ATPase [Vibrio sp. NC2]MCT4348328.1 AAA family ATPase [Vibrio sp. NC2]
MYLRSLKIKNFRKFKTTANEIKFVSNGIGESRPENMVASAATLIVGKNNAGKTTVTKALELIVNSKKEIKGNDFNFHYLKKILEKFNYDSDFNIYPELEFVVDIRVTNVAAVGFNNIYHFVDVESGELPDELDIRVKSKFTIKEQAEFSDKLYYIKTKYSNNEQLLFSKFLELIDNTKFKVSYYNSKNEYVDDNVFNLSNIIEVKNISANKNLNGKNLSSVFNKIIKKRYRAESSEQDYVKLIDEIDKLNISMSKKISITHSDAINNVLVKLESSKKLKVNLSSDLNFDKLMLDLIKYEFDELGIQIPEGQYGLGYTNLVSIVGDLIDYIDDCPESEVQSKINIICIEEPETFMHPQMQESFIKYIDDAIKVLVSNAERKKINSQIIITTHSAHILNSKIHSSNSFDNINYLTTSNDDVEVIRLDDSEINKKSPKRNNKEETQEEYRKRKSNDLRFLKTHIKFKVSELFFSDAVIFVEGATEEVVLNYYLSNCDNMMNYHISIFSITGAHGLVYQPLLSLLKIPTLIITDLDIKKSSKEKSDYAQISSLIKRTSTNSTINYFFKNIDYLNFIDNYYSKYNIRCVYQSERINGYYATSFEEAFILSNSENEILNKALEYTKPKIYKDIVGSNIDKRKLISESYKFQAKLTDDKSDFANNLIYEIASDTENQTPPSLPAYIDDGLFWLEYKILESL